LTAAVTIGLEGKSFASDSVKVVIDQCLTKTVKITGAGGYLGLEPYQSGLLIGEDGLILTVWSHVLLEPGVTVTLHDGRRFSAEVIRVDPRWDLALLRIEGKAPAWFELDQAAAAVHRGQWVFALSNAFGVATGAEPLSVQRGVIAARGPLVGKRGPAGAEYRMEVYYLDFVTSNPGAAGGAVVDAQGRLVGMLGKALYHQSARIWANYAIPADLLARWVAEARSEGVVASGSGPASPPAAEGMFLRKTASPQEVEAILRRLGLILVAEVVPRMPIYVDFVIPGSPAGQAGLKADDLIVTANGQVIRSGVELAALLQQLQPGQVVRLGVQRGEEFWEAELTLPTGP
jgi:serine protease Do